MVRLVDLGLDWRRLGRCVDALGAIHDVDVAVDAFSSVGVDNSDLVDGVLLELDLFKDDLLEDPRDLQRQDDPLRREVLDDQPPRVVRQVLLDDVIVTVAVGRLRDHDLRRRRRRLVVEPGKVLI